MPEELETEGEILSKENQLPPLEFNKDTAVWLLLSITSIAFTVYHIYYSYVRYTDQGRHTVMSVGLALLVFFLLNIFEQDFTGYKKKAYLGITSVMLFISMYITYYFFSHYFDLIDSLLLYSQLEYVIAALMVVIVLEGTRRAFGNVFATAILLTVLYAYFGNYLIGPFQHSGVSIKRILETNMLTLSGIYGFIPQVGATWVAIFLIYAGLLQGYGTMSVFLSVVNRFGSKIQSGPGQMAVLGSMFMGSINGTALGNIAVTGSFTIPIMKDNDVPPPVAGGIEAIASSGGQVLPPIMGTSAFLMASILGVAYMTVIQVALLPAILLYATLVFTVYIIFRKEGIRADFKSTQVRVNQDREPNNLLRAAIPLAVSIAVLIYTLAWLRYGPMSSAFYSIVVLIGTKAMVVIGARRDRESVREVFLETLQGFQIGGITTAPIMVALAGVAVMVEMLQTGRLIQEILFTMLNLSGGQILILLFLAMILSLVFGMGMPTVAAYVLVATLVGPAVTEFGVNQLYGHMFVFYFAVFSVLTPPFALACVVASRIANAGFFGTCREALKIGTPIFLLPYAMVVHSNLLEWTAATPLTFLMVLGGMVGITVAIFGYLFEELSLPVRGLAFGSALVVMLTQETTLNSIGIIVIALIVMRATLRNRSSIRNQVLD